MSPLVAFSGTASRLATRARRHRAKAQFVAGAMALGLGFWGWSLKEPIDGGAAFFNNVFRTLQLITLNFPTEFDKQVSWQLQAARLAVPLVAVLATFDVLVGAVTRPLRLALLPRAKNHLIVVGDTKLTDDALKALARQGRQIVAVAADIDVAHRDTLEGFGMTVIEASPTEPGTLQGLSVRDAAALLLTGDDDLENLDLATLTLGAVQGRDEHRPPLTLAVLIDREDLANELDAALDNVTRHHRVRYRRLCPDREGLRLELAQFAPVFTKPDREAPSHILIVGLAGRWEQTVTQLVIAGQDHPSERPVLSVAVGDEDGRQLAAWRAARPDLDLVVRFEVLPETGFTQADDQAAWRMRCGAPDLVVLLVDDSETVPMALSLRRKGNPFDAESPPMLVRRTRKDRLLTEIAKAGLGDRDLTHIRPFGGLIRAQTIERLIDGRGDEIAVALHAQYLATQAGAKAGASAAQAAWDDLPENLRDANRASAAHAPILFASAGFSIGAPSDPPVEFTGSVLERLARVEHRRWVADRIDKGWRYGSTRDDARRLHPQMRDYDALDAAEQAKDRDTVLTLAAALRAAGQGLSRKRLRDRNLSA